MKGLSRTRIFYGVLFQRDFGLYGNMHKIYIRGCVIIKNGKQKLENSPSCPTPPPPLLLPDKERVNKKGGGSGSVISHFQLKRTHTKNWRKTLDFCLIRIPYFFFNWWGTLYRSDSSPRSHPKLKSFLDKSSFNCQRTHIKQNFASWLKDHFFPSGWVGGQVLNEKFHYLVLNPSLIQIFLTFKII